MRLGSARRVSIPQPCRWDELENNPQSVATGRARSVTHSDQEPT
jgi:hypothetical protein